MERAMLIAFEKAFRDPAKDIQRLKGEAHGNLYMVLAGSYYHSGDTAKSVVSAVKAVSHNPLMAKRIVGFPFRLAGRLFQ
jgi:hypothetical protein